MALVASDALWGELESHDGALEEGFAGGAATCGHRVEHSGGFGVPCSGLELGCALEQSGVELLGGHVAE